MRIRELDFLGDSSQDDDSYQKIRTKNKILNCKFFLFDKNTLQCIS